LFDVPVHGLKGDAHFDKFQIHFAIFSLDHSIEMITALAGEFFLIKTFYLEFTLYSSCVF